MTNISKHIYHLDEFEDIDVLDESEYMKRHIRYMILWYNFGKSHNIKTRNIKTLGKMIKEHFPEMLFE